MPIDVIKNSLANTIPTDITYADLAIAIGESKLKAGTLYRITDFATKHYIVDGNGTKYPQVDTITWTGTPGTATISINGLDDQSFPEDISTMTGYYAANGITLNMGEWGWTFTSATVGVSFPHPTVVTTGDLAGTVANTQLNDGVNTGATEPLIVLATSTSTIDKQAYSATYPQDIIHYDWNPANWMDDLSFADAENAPATAIISGFKGVIYFRHDTALDNYCGYDFRTVKFRRWKTDAIAWSAETEYDTGDKCLDSGYIYYSKSGGNLNHIVSDPAFWAQVIDTSYSEYWFCAPQTTAAYADLYTFNACNVSSTYELSARGNHIEGYRDNYSMQNANKTLLSNNVFHLEMVDNWFTYSNTIESLNYANTIGPDFGGNHIGCVFCFNIIGSSCSGNTVSTNFSSNIIGTFCHKNSVMDGFYNNMVGNYFTMNSVADDFNSVSGCDFLSATHVYEEYNCNLFKRADGTQKLSYFNNSDAMVVVNANA